MALFKNITIIGLGLIGSSIALAAKKYNATKQVTAFDLNEESISQGLKQGIIDKGFNSLEKAIENSELVIICTPISTYESIINEIAPKLNKNTILTDVGSVKKSVINIIEKKINYPENFVPAHPIAGSEKSGLLAGNPELFIDKEFIISPAKESSTYSITKVDQFWQILGSNIKFIPPEEHDEIYAKSSHIPHLVSFCYTKFIIKHFNKPLSKIIDDNGDEFAAFIRLAKSNARMWTDIFIHNKHPVIEYTERFFQNNKKNLHSEENLNNLFIQIENAKKARLELDRLDDFKKPVPVDNLALSFIPSFITCKLVEIVEGHPRIGGGFLGMTQVILNFNESYKNAVINNIDLCSELLDKLDNEITHILKLIKDSNRNALMNYLLSIK